VWGVKEKSRWSRMKNSLDLTPEGVARTDAILAELAEEHER